MNNNIEKIKSLIAENRFDKAFLELEKLNIKEIENDIVISKGRLKVNREQFNSGIVTIEDFNVEYRKIALALLELLDDIFDNNENEISPIFLKLGQEMLLEKDFLSAKKYFDKALNEDNSLIDAYFDRGTAKLALGEFIDAIVDFSIVINRTPKNGLALYNRGVSFFKLEQIDKACEDWNKVKELGLDIADEALLLCNFED